MGKVYIVVMPVGGHKLWGVGGKKVAGLGGLGEWVSGGRLTAGGGEVAGMVSGHLCRGRRPRRPAEGVGGVGQADPGPFVHIVNARQLLILCAVNLHHGYST